jgi:hypothetical protein
MRKRTFVVAALAASALAVPQAAQPATKTLYATVGPGETITMKTAAGARVKTLKAGTYTIVVQDKSADHNFRLFGKGVSKTTAVGFTGKKMWRNVRLGKGTYRFVCDPHAGHMAGSFRVS